MDIVKKHADLKRRIAEAKEAALEARATRRSLEEREKEYIAELEVLGVDPDNLDAAVEQAKQAIADELKAIEQALENPTFDQSPPPSPESTSVDAEQVIKSLDVDDLLNIGSSN